MDNDEQLARDPDHDSFSNASDARYGKIINGSDRRIERAKHERLDNADPLERVSEKMTLEGFDVDGNVRKLRHA